MYMLILTVNGLKVLGLVLAQGLVSRLTVNNPSVKALEGFWLLNCQHKLYNNN